MGRPYKWGIGSYALAWTIGVPGYPAPPEPFHAEDLIAVAAELGAPLVQICDNLPLHDLGKELLQALGSFAIENAVSVEVGTRGNDPRILSRYLDMASQLGSPIVRTVLDDPAAGSRRPAGSMDAGSMLKAAEAKLRQVLPLYESHGISLAIENHGTYGCAALTALIERIGSPCLGVCLDTVNSLGTLESLDSVVGLLAPYTLSFHAKDFDIRRLPHSMGFEVVGTPVGKGRLDVQAVLQRIEAAGGHPSVILELWPPYQGGIEETVRLERSWLEAGARYLSGLLG